MHALQGLSLVLLLAVAIGSIVNLAQLAIAWWSSRKKPTLQAPTLGISILKPLCGADDDLEENLRQFATFSYPKYELILGVKDASDAAYPIAVAAAQRWPDRVRVVLQRGEPGMNPKVNQLCTLEQHAQNEIILVSDSNCRVPAGYLEEIATVFQSDPQVACTSNPIIGIGEERLGSALDNFYVASTVAPGVISAKAAGRDIVIGKSMALRKTDLVSMGGFYTARNHLAEDYVLGKRIVALGKKIHVCQLPVYQVSQRRSLKDFLNRQRRWAIIHRTAIAPITYVGQALMNPVPVALLALVLAPSRFSLWAFAAAWALKTATDVAAIRLYRPAFGLMTPWYLLLKDLVIFAAWCGGIFRRTVMWRGNRLRVDHGSLLVPLDGPAADQELSAVGAEAHSHGRDAA